MFFFKKANKSFPEFQTPPLNKKEHFRRLLLSCMTKWKTTLKSEQPPFLYVSSFPDALVPFLLFFFFFKQTRVFFLVRCGGPTWCRWTTCSHTDTQSHFLPPVASDDLLLLLNVCVSLCASLWQAGLGEGWGVCTIRKEVNRMSAASFQPDERDIYFQHWDLGTPQHGPEWK